MHQRMLVEAIKRAFPSIARCPVPRSRSPQARRGGSLIALLPFATD